MKTLFRRIYFDMDGVLADFGIGAKYITKTTGFTTRTDDFWKIVNKSADSFYSDLPPIPDIFDLVYQLKHRQYNLNILSKVPYSCVNKAMIGKTIWLNKWYKDVFNDVIFVPTQNEKHFYCKEKDILIDDDIINIDKWIIEGKGLGFHYIKGCFKAMKERLMKTFQIFPEISYLHPQVETKEEY